MADEVTADALVQHALKIKDAQGKLKAAMAGVAAEVASQPPPTPAAKPAS